MTEERTKEIAELEVRRYFDHYLRDVYPVQAKGLITMHDSNRKAHGGAESKINRLLWGIFGVVGIAGFLVTLKEILG